ncbi:MAG: guanine deaminase [Oceanospirillaceae bacterium]|uniref:guanine deaminase n=1 Tax=unclassified Thalassolituus TaxID=2624967 RepID=UPI000C0B70AA|nr:MULTISPECIES: guanine deaminase [unclassified Thalassolituus]MAK90631.1 guanine deaminase [Thalassolituus sp.]MAS26003.1 guanine deaminase [Oceanospirillaceae bacterium]MAX99946.1 guanine deaminase [Oceanospirillaceae bacterium]MBL35346.1 guanine deaminase [Oceanospirillaceae bacterium]MBS51950.1 guanine deaminase [Oceanospirillaceae bacterium]|tara:strand:+ start:683 stop:1993 length:1311 start_codon:yes stop_codon:yes gene_type:complete
MTLKGYHGRVLHYLDENTPCYFDDGILVVDTESGTVQACGKADEMLQQFKGLDITSYQNSLIMPGLIDTHIHYPQVDVIASYGTQLLDWLNNYTFPTELAFANPEVAEETAEFFLNELLKNGTTTALVFGTVHKGSVDAFFNASEKRNTRMICGKVMMDRNAPEDLCDTVESSVADTQALIDSWHGKGRQLYAITPRFAITSTPEQLAAAGKLLADNPGVYMQTHLAENKDEVAFVQELFPQSKSYLDVYDQYGLLGERSIFAHCIYLEDDDYRRMNESGSKISFCPTSNLFIGSGLFKLDDQPAAVEVSVATDVGGGTSFSMLQTMNEAYKVCQLRGSNLSAQRAFYMMTLGNAKALSLDDKIGNFEAGKEADFVVFDLAGTDLMKRRQSICKDIDETLFSLMILGDDRAVSETFVAGQQVWSKQQDKSKLAGAH